MTPKLDGVESPKLTCHIKTDFDIEENDCNPDTFTVPRGDHTVTIDILNASDQSTVVSRIIILHGFRPNQSV